MCSRVDKQHIKLQMQLTLRFQNKCIGPKLNFIYCHIFYDCGVGGATYNASLSKLKYFVQSFVAI